MVPRSKAPHLAIAVYAVCLIAHLLYVSLFAHEIPFWDQWDAEADHLFRPFLEGTLTAGDLFAPHNEHRIFFSRIWALALFTLNGGEWSNLVEAYASSAIYAAVPATLVYFACRKDTPRITTIAIVIVACVLAALPFDFENTLYGFQSQFYFMAEFAVLLLATAAYAQVRYLTLAALVVLGSCSLFTMASGLIAPVAAIVALCLRRDMRQDRRFFLVAVGSLSLIALIGAWLIPNLGSQDGASGIGGHVKAVATTFMWPLQTRVTDTTYAVARNLLYAVCLWAPTLAWLVLRVRSRDLTRNEIFVVGVAAWVAMQGAAVAHARGHDLIALSSRYTDIFTLGILCNVWLACWLIARQKAYRPVLLAAFSLFFAGEGIGLARSIPAGLYANHVSRDHGDRQIANVRAFLASNDDRHLVQPLYEIPYPDPKRLAALLGNPAIRSTLPSTLLPAPQAESSATEANIPERRNAPLSRLARGLQQFVLRNG